MRHSKFSLSEFTLSLPVIIKHYSVSVGPLHQKHTATNSQAPKREKKIFHQQTVSQTHSVFPRQVLTEALKSSNSSERGLFFTRETVWGSLCSTRQPCFEEGNGARQGKGDTKCGEKWKSGLRGCICWPLSAGAARSEAFQSKHLDRTAAPSKPLKR